MTFAQMAVDRNLRPILPVTSQNYRKWLGIILKEAFSFLPDVFALLIIPQIDGNHGNLLCNNQFKFDKNWKIWVGT